MKDEHYKKRLMAKSLKGVIKDADTWFSRYIRAYWADDNGMVKCCTCGGLHKMNDIDNGHFVRRDVLTLRWEFFNCHPQCTRCNQYLDGSEAEHLLYIEKEHGRDVVDELMASKRAWKSKIYKPNKERLIDKIVNWKNEVKRLKKEKNIL